MSWFSSTLESLTRDLKVFAEVVATDATSALGEARRSLFEGEAAAGGGADGADSARAEGPGSQPDGAAAGAETDGDLTWEDEFDPEDKLGSREAGAVAAESAEAAEPAQEASSSPSSSSSSATSPSSTTVAETSAPRIPRGVDEGSTNNSSLAPLCPSDAGSADAHGVSAPEPSASLAESAGSAESAKATEPADPSVTVEVAAPVTTAPVVPLATTDVDAWDD